MLNFKDVQENPQILEFIKQTETTLRDLSYTDHGLRHSSLVAERAREISQKIGLDKRVGELAAISGFCHDMGSFISRSHHNFFGAILFHQVFQKEFAPEDLVKVMQAIAGHDENDKELSFTDPVSAVVALADKSDVNRSRVTNTEDIKTDIHDRVNFATEKSELEIDNKNKRIILELKIDTKVVPIIEYFEIFTKRMVFCRRAAKFLGYDFGLVINDFRLL